VRRKGDRLNRHRVTLPVAPVAVKQKQHLQRLGDAAMPTIKRIEGASEIRGAADTLWKIQKALEAAGIEFIPEEAGRGLASGLSRF